METNSLELKRKIAHILFGITGLLLLTYHLFNSFILFIILVIGIFISILSINFKIPVIDYFLQTFERDIDKKQLPGRGIIFAFVGIILALQLFSKDIALASIAILVFADPISHLVGRFFGKTPSLLDNKKNIEGHIAGALISSLIASFYVPFYLAFPAALISMLFESIIIEIQKIKLDDNLIIPLTAGTTMLLILKFLV